MIKTQTIIIFIVFSKFCMYMYTTYMYIHVFIAYTHVHDASLDAGETVYIRDMQQSHQSQWISDFSV